MKINTGDTAPAKTNGPSISVPRPPPASSLVYDAFWRFAYERQEVFFHRMAGAPRPWTTDVILQTYRFTNVYRASDRTSQFLIREVVYRGDQCPEEVFFRTLLFKLFNRIETWMLLERVLGSVCWSSYSFADYDSVLGEAIQEGAIYSPAYIIPSPLSFGHVRKHQNHLRLIEAMMSNGVPQRVMESESLEEVFLILLRFPGIGKFLAYQFAIDLNYSPLTHHSEMSFVVPGPGALDGIQKCFPEMGNWTPSDIIRHVTERQEEEFSCRSLAIRSLWGRPLQLIDVQNVFCEIGKYARVAHPSIPGTSNRKRIKQRFVPRGNSVPSWYPPKWNLNERIIGNQGSR